MVLQFLMMPSARQKVGGVLEQSVSRLHVVELQNVLIRSKRVWVYLDAHGPRGMLARSNFVQAKHFARRVVELVMVDLDIREGGIELYVDITQPGRELEGRHVG